MKPGDTATFNTEKFEATVSEMKAKGESVHARGREVFARTGRLDKLVDVLNQQRLSHNSMAKSGDKIVLTNGVAMPVFSIFDGTGSMAENSARAHTAQGRIHAMLGALKSRYNFQLACGVAQDVCDTHGPFMLGQCEGDERSAEQIRLLVPDGNGGDETEDYQLAVAYLAFCTDLDIANFYKLKGYGFIVGDQIGREHVTVGAVDEYLGNGLIQNDISTREVAQLLLPRLHMFYIHVGSGGRGGSEDFATEWWRDKFGKGHVVICHDPELIAEVQCALVYVTETASPTEDGLFSFLTAGGTNKLITKEKAAQIWRWIVEAEVEFGAQTKLPGYAEIPLPGAVFEHYRHQWPIDHPKFSTNYVPVEKVVTPFVRRPAGSTNWANF